MILALHGYYVRPHHRGKDGTPMTAAEATAEFEPTLEECNKWDRSTSVNDVAVSTRDAVSRAENTRLTAALISIH
jgi:hypothetical protein